MQADDISFMKPFNDYMLIPFGYEDKKCTIHLCHQFFLLEHYFRGNIIGMLILSNLSAQFEAQIFPKNWK